MKLVAWLWIQSRPARGGQAFAGGFSMLRAML
jgi:hypothetical protein